MADDWAVRFRSFSLAVDSVSDDALEHTKDLLANYLANTLGACYFEVLLDGMRMSGIDGDFPAMSTRWSSKPGNEVTLAIQGPDNRCTAQTAYAYVYRKPLWISAEDGEQLVDAQARGKPFVDSWSGSRDLPRYRDYGESIARTSILVPLTYGTRTFGVLNLEFEDSLPITDNGKETVRVLAASLARVLWLHQTYSTTNQDTLRAFEGLEGLPTQKISPLRRRTVFLSTSSQADEAVVDVLRSVLEDFDDVFELKFWRDETLSGNIKQQVRDALVSAEFGVCYLSQKSDSEGDEYPFEDNVNVIFEAGMLQAVHELRSLDAEESLSRWIPVREMPPFSGPPPFDFATDRIVMVPRDQESGLLDIANLSERFRAAVESQIESLDLR